MKPILVPSCLAEETELLEAMDWNEEAVEEILETCRLSLGSAATEPEAEFALRELSTKLVSKHGLLVARLAISLFLKQVMQNQKQEIEA